MKVKYQRFLTDLARIPSEQRKAIEKFVFEEVPILNSLGENGKVERLKGYQSCYKEAGLLFATRAASRRYKRATLLMGDSFSSLVTHHP